VKMSERSIAAVRTLRAKWSEVNAPVIEHEDRFSNEKCDELWTSLYSLFAATGEGAQSEVKLAVWCYYAVNGTSKRTPHGVDINTAGGTSVPASDVLRVIGAGNTRRFLRGTQEEAYVALTETQALQEDEVFVAKVASKYSIPRAFVHCAVDFLRDCPMFTPEEVRFSDIAFKTSVERATRARGGRTMDEEDSSSHLATVRAGTVMRHTNASQDSGF